MPPQRPITPSGSGRPSRRALLVTGAAIATGIEVAPAAAGAAALSDADIDAADLDAFVAAAPTGAVLHITRAWSRSAPLVLDRPVTLRFEGAGAITVTTHATAIEITSSHVCVEDARLSGPSGAVFGEGRGVRARGTAEAPLRELRVAGCVLTGFSYDAIEFEHVRDFAVASNRVADVGYAGIMLLSCTDGSVTSNTVADVHQPSGYVNSYGVIVSRNDSRDLASAPRSARVTVDRNRVSGVRLWEGIDTHSGEDLVIRDNTVQDCRVGIAVVASKDAVDRSYRYASTGVLVAQNHIERRSLQTPGSGIVLRGAGSTVGDERERTTATVTGNTVIGHGGAPREAGILAYLTRSLVLSDNVLQGCVRSAVTLYHSDTDATLTRNAVDGVVPAEPDGVTVAIEAPAAESTAQVMATRVRPTAEGVPCSIGVVCGVGSTLTLLANDWSGAAQQFGGGGQILRYAED